MIRMARDLLGQAAILTNSIPINDPLSFSHRDHFMNTRQYELILITQASKHKTIIRHNTTHLLEELCPLNVISWCWGSAKILVVAQSSFFFLLSKIFSVTIFYNNPLIFFEPPVEAAF